MINSLVTKNILSFIKIIIVVDAIKSDQSLTRIQFSMIIYQADFEIDVLLIAIFSI